MVMSPIATYHTIGDGVILLVNVHTMHSSAGLNAPLGRACVSVLP